MYSSGPSIRTRSQCGRCESGRSSANLPKTSLYQETLSEIIQVKKGQDWFAMVPVEVMRGRNISPAEKIVWAAMAMHSMGSGQVCMSHQTIATASGLTRLLVLQSVRNLIKTGMIQPDGAPKCQVQPYRVLQMRSRASAAVQSVPTIGRRTERPFLECGRCHQLRRGLMKTGWCRSCNSDIDLDRRIRRIVLEELARSA